MGLRISATEKFFLSPKAIDQRFTKGLNIKKATLYLDTLGLQLTNI